jgi:hypothetical protein
MILGGPVFPTEVSSPATVNDPSLMPTNGDATPHNYILVNTEVKRHSLLKAIDIYATTAGAIELKVNKNDIIIRFIQFINFFFIKLKAKATDGVQ